MSLGRLDLSLLSLLCEGVPASLGLGLRTAGEANGESVIKFITDYHLLSWVQRIVKLRKPNSPLHLRKAFRLRRGRGRMTYPGRQSTGGRESPKCARKSPRVAVGGSIARSG